MNPAEQAEQKLALAPLDHRLALTFTPQTLRPALTALFALYLEIREVPVECRDPGVAEVKLAWWQQEIEALHLGKPHHPLAQALLPFIETLAGHKEPFLDIITGTRMDVTGSKFLSFEDVKRYCYRHSGALAELSAVLMGARSREALLSARLLGNSYRLAYITTAGVPEALHGRVYFAAEDIQTHGVDKHIHAESADPSPVQALLQVYASRVRTMRREAVSAVPQVDRGKLIPWAVLASLGLKRVSRLESAGFRPAAEAVELRPLSALFTAWRAARTAG